jgi:hypothetical protein
MSYFCYLQVLIISAVNLLFLPLPFLIFITTSPEEARVGPSIVGSVLF